MKVSDLFAYGMVALLLLMAGTAIVGVVQRIHADMRRPRCDEKMVEQILTEEKRRREYNARAKAIREKNRKIRKRN